MTLSRTLLLGLLAGATILIGLPIGRLRRPATGLRVLLNAAAVGVLLFLLWDVMSAAWEPIDEALVGMHDGEGGAPMTFVKLRQRVVERRSCRLGASRRGRRCAGGRGRSGLHCGVCPGRSCGRSRRARRGRAAPRTRTGTWLV
jgi:hypothetical protein